MMQCALIDLRGMLAIGNVKKSQKYICGGAEWVMQNQLVLFEEEVRQIQGVCSTLHKDSNSKAVFVIDRDGQPIATAGELEDYDVTAVSTLAAGNVAATSAIAGHVHEKEFGGQFLEGAKVKLYSCNVLARMIVLVIFDERSSQGLVRLRIKRAMATLTPIVSTLIEKSKNTSMQSVLADISDDDIDNLFSD